MYHSFSSWQLYLQCPYAWGARYVTKKEIKRPDTPALIKGRQVHEFMEETVKTGKLEQNMAKIPSDVYFELQDMLDGAKVVKTELEICFDFDGSIIKKDWSNPFGVIVKIDLFVVDRNGRIVISDYKTGSSSGKVEQLCLYSYPFNTDTKCKFLYMDKNEVETKDVPAMASRYVFSRFEKYVEKVEGTKENANDYEKVECQNCRWCMVKDCPMARGLK